MEITTYSNFRQHLKKFLDIVTGDRQRLYVTRSSGEDVVVISKSEFDSMQETFYLLKSPANALRLMEGLEEYKSGEGQERELLDE